MELDLLALAGKAEIGIALSMVTLALLMWQSTAPEISSSRTPVTSEFERLPRRARFLLWRELESLSFTVACFWLYQVLVGTVDPLLPPNWMAQFVWRSTAPEISSSRTPVTSEFGRCPRRARSLLWRELELFFLTLAGTA